jgi:hypothetical protein
VPQASTRETTRSECTPVEHGGERLGVTVPAGFSVTTTPSGSEGLTESQDVDLLAVAQHRDATGRLPTVVVAVYAYAAGEGAGQEGLRASVANFRTLVGADDASAPVTAKPATVAGRRGSAGGAEDETAMDFQEPDGEPSPLHWWTVSSGRGQFVVLMGSRDAATDHRYAPQFLSGLKAGGC